MNYVPPIKDKSQIEALKAALRCQSERNYIIFVLAINYGRRISDILEMKVCDIRGKEYIEIKENKTKKSIRLKINPETYSAVIAYAVNKTDDEYLFPSKKLSKDYNPDSKGHTPIDRIDYWKYLNAAAQECGIESIGTHSLRKTFGYWLYKNTGDIALVQKVFGHRTQLDTLRYIGMEQEYIDSATTALVL